MRTSARRTEMHFPSMIRPVSNVSCIGTRLVGIKTSGTGISSTCPLVRDESHTTFGKIRLFRPTSTRSGARRTNRARNEFPFAPLASRASRPVSSLNWPHRPSQPFVIRSQHQLTRKLRNYSTGYTSPSTGRPTRNSSDRTVVRRLDPESDEAMPPGGDIASRTHSAAASRSITSRILPAHARPSNRPPLAPPPVPGGQVSRWRDDFTAPGKSQPHR